jgi:hypothetical protein
MNWGSSVYYLKIFVVGGGGSKSMNWSVTSSVGVGDQQIVDLRRKAWN